MFVLRPSAFVLALFVLLPSSCVLSFATERKLWTGRGETTKASEDANWSPPQAPRAGERVLFGYTSSKDCAWDYDVAVSSIVLTRLYRGRVSLGTSKVETRLHVRVAGGTLDLGDARLTVQGLLYMDQGGKVQLNRGELRLGRKGLLVDNGGTLLSTGDKPARIGSATGEYYDFRVGRGTVNLANPSGTLVERSKGVVLFSSAKVEKAANVAVTQVPKGATAVTVFSPEAADVELQDWTFDETVEKQVDAPALLKQGKTLVVKVTASTASTPLSTGPLSAGPPGAVPEPLPVVKPPEQPPEPEEVEEEAPPAGPSMAEALAEEEKVKITPLFNLQILGGQYFFKGQQGNLSGNAGFLAAPVVKFSERWSLLPTYAGSYQGTKQVVDLVGAGTLFQQRMAHRLGAKAVYRPDADSLWRFKPSAGYKWELLEETRDERWGKGLFDTQKAGAGFEAEYVYRDPFSVRASYDYATTRFPNYTTLESQQKFDSNGRPLARELVGGHTLDSRSHALSLAGSAQVLPGLILEPSYIFLLQDYPNQHIVEASGDFGSGRRKDTTQVADLSLRHPRQVGAGMKMLVSLGLGAIIARSNQNSYDALNTKFISNYYDYDEYSLRPSVTAFLAQGARSEKPMALSLGLSATQRQYKSRPTQDAMGAYRADKIRTLLYAANATLTFPMDRNFSLMANLQYGKAGSNMAFQQFYKYDYSTVNYLFGVNYEY